MKVLLVSSDSDLHMLCREILDGFKGYDWQLSSANSMTCPEEADFYIWDCQGKSKIPPEIPPEVDQRPAKHLFLVHRNDISKFQNLGSLEAPILLKPVSRASMSVFLGLAAAASKEPIATANYLRADRDEMFQCLIQSNLKLQEYDHDRTNFLARAVHDFRAPLTATIGYCGLLLSEALGHLNEDQQELLRRMQHSTKRLSRMASAMFELSVGRLVKRQPDLKETEIEECVQQALHEITPFADAKQISISLDLDAVPAPLFLEGGQIEQVLINLLENACKFTPRGGAIEIRGWPCRWDGRSRHSTPDEQWLDHSEADNAYRLDIRDSGPPIPPSHLESIFEEYTSYNGGQDRSGGGLGLAICRMIISLHNGSVWAENTIDGPQFSFVLPVRLAEAGSHLDQVDTIPKHIGNL
jgi:signal transduction histidine kinase